MINASPRPFGLVLAALVATLVVASAAAQSPAKRPRFPEPKVNKIEGDLEPAPAGHQDVIALLPNVVSTKSRTTLSSPLACQVLRQGLWLAAREECGLHVLDANLGERAPDNLPGDRRIKFGPVSDNDHSQWDFHAGFNVIWQGSLDGGRSERFYKTPLLNIEESEAHSRTWITKGLVAARFPAKPNKRSDAPLPAEIEKLLSPMRETSQFAAVRQLHAEMRKQGESSALLGGLVRGYANLGLLTAYQWSPVSAVFQARSLLYAQRLVVKDPTSPNALRLRAYALGLTGLHKTAIEDLEAAAKLTSTDKAPEWLEPLDAYLHFDQKRLKDARKTLDTPLTQLLQYLSIEEPLLENVTLKAAREMLGENPECYRVYEAACQTNGLGTLRQTTAVWGQVLSSKLSQRVREQEGLPKAVSDVLAEASVTEDQIYAALRKAGDPTNDPGEPSWSVLASLTENARFAQVWYQLYTLDAVLGVSAEDEAKDALKILAGHPYRFLIESFTINRDRDPVKWLKKMTDSPADLLDLRARTYSYLLQRAGGEQSRNWYWAAEARNGRAYPDAVRALRYYSLEAWKVLSMSPGLASPFSPQAIAHGLMREPAPAAARLAEIEKQYADFPLVQEALARVHGTAGRFADSARCWERRIEQSPDVESHRTLAAMYKSNKKDDLWLKTLEASLAFDDPGLGHAQVRVEIAYYFMAQKDFKKAEPYAMAAGQSYAAWALDCAGECQIGLGKWDAANDIFRARSARYPSTVFDWYNLCRKHGKMDREAAEKAVEDYLAEFGMKFPPVIAGNAGRFYLMTGRLKEAAAQFDSHFKAQPSRKSCLFAALIADGLGDPEGRDAHLAKLGNLPPRADADWPTLQPLTETIRKMAAKKEAPDAAAVNAALKGLTPADRANAALFLGWVLSNRGEAARAAALWKECRDSEDGFGWLKTHAAAFLDQQESARNEGKP